MFPETGDYFKGYYNEGYYSKGYYNKGYYNELKTQEIPELISFLGDARRL